MRFKFNRTILEAQEHESPIADISWSPNNAKLAVATSDRVVLLFDENGVRKDKFSTKPADPNAGKKSYVITCLAFSENSELLAVAQSDAIVFVYRLGTDWNTKKVICNKFITSSAPMCIRTIDNSFVIGTLEGKIRLLDCKSNKSSSLWTGSSGCVSLATLPMARIHESDGKILSGHIDGNIYMNGKLIFKYVLPPTGLAFTPLHILVGACDGKISVYDSHKYSLVRTAERQEKLTPETRDIIKAVSCPSGQTIAFATWNGCLIVDVNENGNVELVTLNIDNFYATRALCWSNDGTKLVMASQHGCVVMYEAVLRRWVWRNTVEVRYVGPKRILITRLAKDAATLVVESTLGNDIFNVKFLGDNWYAVCKTNCSLIVCDLMRGLFSEVSWHNSGGELYFTQAPAACLVYRAGELSVIQYGVNDILHVVRTEKVTPHVLSVRINEGVISENENKKLAYLLDKQTVAVVDLVSGQQLIQSWHDCRIDWLELNESANVLLIRDTRKKLSLINIDNGGKDVIASGVGFVQWVENSDAVVAQTPTHILVWYSIQDTSDVELLEFGGGQAVEVNDGRVTLQGGQLPFVTLDKHRLHFNSSIRANNLSGCADYLKTIPDSNVELSQLWRQLAHKAFQVADLELAAECYKEIGDVAKSHFISKTLELARSEGEDDLSIGLRSPLVQARMAIFNKDFALAEKYYIKSGNHKSAVDIYKSLYNWQDAIAVAEKYDHSHAELLRKQRMDYLISTGRVMAAGSALWSSGKQRDAITVWSSGGGGAVRRAAGALVQTPTLLSDEALRSDVMRVLKQEEWWEEAGEIAEKCGDSINAIDYYVKGNSYARAVQLAREVCPERVSTLEGDWGKWLAATHRPAAALPHLIEAGHTHAALKAALAARVYRQAVQILQSIDDKESVRNECEELGNHFISVQDWETAEKVLVDGGLTEKCVSIYNEIGRYSDGLKLALEHLSREQVKQEYTKIAVKLQQEGKLRKAESIYISLGDYDAAITMYKEVEQYDGMVRLVETYRPDLLNVTLSHVARTLQAKDDYAAAERYFLQAGDWKSVIQMYRTAENWEAAERVATEHAPPAVVQQVVAAWAISMNGVAGARLAMSRNAGDVTQAAAITAGRWSLAEHLAEMGARMSKEEVALQRAYRAQDPEESEALYLDANAPELAVDMWLERQDFNRALQLASENVPSKVDEVLESYAEWAIQHGDLPLYESLMLRANRVQELIDYYINNGMENEANRLRMDIGDGSVSGRSEPSNMVAQYIQRAARAADSGDYWRALNDLCKASEVAADENQLEVAERAVLRAARLARDKLKHPQRAAAANIIADRLIAIGQEEIAEQLRSALSEGYSNKENLVTPPNNEQGDTSNMTGELERLARSGQWERCLALAGTKAPLYAAKWTAVLLQEDREGALEMSISALRRWGATGLDFGTCLKLLAKASSVLPYNYTVLRDVRDIIYSSEVKSSEDDVGFVACLCSVVCAGGPVGSRAVRALLRYTHLVVADAAYFMAGMIARKEGNTSEALIILNHCLDLVEATEEGTDPSTLDYEDFQCTDFPRKVLLLDRTCLDESKLADVREWVLATSMELQSHQSLPVDQRGLYPSALGADGECCVLTGYPLSSRLIKFSNGKCANRESWSRLVAMSNDDHDNEIPSDIIAFMTLWCGPNDYKMA